MAAFNQIKYIWLNVMCPEGSVMASLLLVRWYSICTRRLTVYLHGWTFLCLQHLALFIWHHLQFQLLQLIAPKQQSLVKPVWLTNMDSCRYLIRLKTVKSTCPGMIWTVQVSKACKLRLLVKMHMADMATNLLMLSWIRILLLQLV